jgi:hypothetical protein
VAGIQTFLLESCRIQKTDSPEGQLRLLSSALVGVVLAVSFPVANAIKPTASQPTLFIAADSGFQTALSAAMLKKHVPISVTMDQDKADYILQAAPVDSKDESGAGKVARCLFLDCVGMNGYSEVSVRLLKREGSTVVWAYQVRKGNSGPLGVQSLSEAIAKHLKNDYLDKQK